jgi:hypothetical protein
MPPYFLEISQVFNVVFTILTIITRDQSTPVYLGKKPIVPIILKFCRVKLGIIVILEKIFSG